MITRPLELSSRLRPEPRNFDAVFLVNGGLLVLFFYLFGSQFVLAPGIGVGFTPEFAGARAAATQTTHRITVMPSGLIFIDDGPADKERLGKWLVDAAKTTRQPSLLIIASRTVQLGTITEIASTATAAGFVHVQWAAEESSASAPGREGR